MPQRIIKPVWNTAKSPITGKALLLFLALVFLAYTVISDYQQRQASAERYKAIVQYTEESRAALVSAKEQTDIYERNAKNTEAIVVFMKAMTEILEAQQKEHAMMISGRTGTSKPIRQSVKKKTTLRTCFEFVPKKKRIGNNEITIQEGVSVPCT